MAGIYLEEWELRTSPPYVGEPLKLTLRGICTDERLQVRRHARRATTRLAIASPPPFTRANTRAHTHTQTRTLPPPLQPTRPRLLTLLAPPHHSLPRCSQESAVKLDRQQLQRTLDARQKATMMRELLFGLADAIVLPPPPLIAPVPRHEPQQAERWLTLNSGR